MRLGTLGLRWLSASGTSQLDAGGGGGDFSVFIFYSWGRHLLLRYRRAA